MESKELKKMSRKDMLVILLEQTKRIRELEDELEKANEKLESKKVVFKNAGSLADAALQLSGIFNTVPLKVKEWTLVLFFSGSIFLINSIYLLIKSKKSN